MHGHNRPMPAAPLIWDVFCRVIDNHGDLGVCWRLARELAARGHGVRLWVDDAGALAWMAPGALQGACPGVQVLPWGEPFDAGALGGLTRSDVWIEAFGCELPKAFVAHGARAAASARPPVWLNLEYLSAEAYVARMHGLPSPVLHGPAAGWTKWFYYPGLTSQTGGLLREADLPARQQAFDRAAWLAAQGVSWQGERLISLFCYEPAALAAWLAKLDAARQPTRLLVTAGRAAQAVRAAFDNEIGRLRMTGVRKQLSISYLSHLSQIDYDHLLWACDINFVRGEDSLVRALWAGRALVWQPYVQDDGAHHAKLEAMLEALGAPPDVRAFHRSWCGVDATPLPVPDWVAWAEGVQAARARLQTQADLVTRLIGFVRQKTLK